MKNLEADEIHVWAIDEKDFSFDHLRDVSEAWLSDSERERVDRFHFQEHKKQLLLGRYFLRWVLSQYSGLAMEDWQFDYNPYGKPSLNTALQSKVGLFFNLSHSKGKLVLALSRLEKLGIDIEFNARQRRVSRIASRYFSDKEIADLSRLKEQEQQKRFFDLWSFKEAYIKACGLGLAIPLNEFSYDFPSSEEVALTFDPKRNDDDASWQLWQLGGIDSFNIAMAAKSLGGDQIKTLDTFSLTDEKAVEFSMPILRQNY